MLFTDDQLRSNCNTKENKIKEIQINNLIQESISEKAIIIIINPKIFERGKYCCIFYFVLKYITYLINTYVLIKIKMFKSV